MADVRPSARSSKSSRERGQLLLVTALGLAILFVSLALIVNTAIYTENLATRSSDIGGGTDAVRFHDATRDGVAGTMAYINHHNNTSFSNLDGELREGVDAYQNRTTRLFAASDRSVVVRFDSSNNGTRVVQNNASRDFSNASGTADWTIATDVSNTREFRMNVSDNQLVDLGLSPFEVVLDSGATWRMSVSSSAVGSITVTVNGPTASGDCTVSQGDAWINVTDGTLAGEPCDVLDSFADGLTTPYEIRFRNGDKVSGTYTLIFDNSSLANSPSPHLNAPGGDDPFATHAVYSTNVTVTYETPRLYYNSTVRVAPGESG